MISKNFPKQRSFLILNVLKAGDQVTHWGGVKFSDFVKAYGLTDESAMKYLGLSTPDEEYYVGIDMPSALHPQTLLCYEMNGQAITDEPGLSFAFDHTGKVWYQKPEADRLYVF